MDISIYCYVYNLPLLPLYPTSHLLDISNTMSTWYVERASKLKWRGRSPLVRSFLRSFLISINHDNLDFTNVSKGFTPTIKINLARMQSDKPCYPISLNGCNFSQFSIALQLGSETRIRLKLGPKDKVSSWISSFHLVFGPSDFILSDMHNFSTAF